MGPKLCIIYRKKLSKERRVKERQKSSPCIFQHTMSGVLYEVRVLTTDGLESCTSFQSVLTYNPEFTGKYSLLSSLLRKNSYFISLVCTIRSHSQNSIRQQRNNMRL